MTNIIIRALHDVGGRPYMNPGAKVALLQTSRPKCLFVCCLARPFLP